MSVEKRNDGEHAAMIVLGLRQRQLAQDAAHMLLNGALGDPQLAGDTRVGPALGHQLEDLALARCEIGEGISDSPRGDEALHQRRVDDRVQASGENRPPR